METGSSPPPRNPSDEPQSPGSSPQSPAPGPPPPPGPESPPGPQPPGYAGPVPPGGWQQPPAPAVAGRQLATWGSRVGAFLLDGLIVGLPALVIIGVFGVGIAATSDDGAGLGAIIGGLVLTVLVLAVVGLIYAPFLMSRQGARNGQTLGKQLLDIRVVRDSGQPFTFGSAALREVAIKFLALGIAGSIIPFIPYLLDYLWPLWDDENRALHDMVVSTHVVRA